MPSKKNGRFSSKKIGKRWLAVTTVWSASTCAKSGLIAASRVMVGVRLNFIVSPGSSRTGRLTHSAGIEWRCNAVWRGGKRARTPSGLRDRQARNQFERALSGDFFQTGELPGLIEDAGFIARDLHPRSPLVVKPLDIAKEVRPPELPLARFVAQRLERDGDLDRVAFIRHDAFRFHHDVNAVIISVTLNEDAIGQHAERIEPERVGPPPVVERI